MKLISQSKTPCQPMSVRSSPYHQDHWISATAENFGLKGKGMLVSSANTRPAMFNDALFDACFYNGSNNVITACGDGFIYHVNMSDPDQRQRSPAGHVKECVSVDSNSQYIVSAGWDGGVLLFNRQLRLLRKFDQQHRTTCHRVVFHPTTECIFMTSGGDGTVKITDTRSKNQSLALCTNGHVDVLSVDWNKYDQTVVASGSADGVVRIFDLRSNCQITQFKGHKRAVKQLQFSPLSADHLATCSYDMSVALWEWRAGVRVGGSDVFGEFVSGLDWSVHRRDRLYVSCWDQTIYTFDPM